MSLPVPTYRLHKPSGKAVVTLCGRDFYLGPWNSPDSRLEYDRLVAEWLANSRQLPDAVPLGELTIVELADAYLQFAEGYYQQVGKPTKEYFAIREVLNLLVSFYGRKRVQKFGPLALKALREQLIKKNLVRGSINARMHRLRRAFRWGVEHELVPPAVLQRLCAVAPLKKNRTRAREAAKIRPVPQKNFQTVLPFVSRQVATMIRLQELTGMRPGEVVLLRPVDVDRSRPVWIYIPQRHKTQHHGLSREICLGPQAQEVLKPWLERDPEAFCFSPAEAEQERNSSLRQQRNSPMTPSQAQRRAAENRRRPPHLRYDRHSYRRAVEY